MRKYTNTVISALLVTVFMVTLSLGFSVLKEHPLGFTLGDGDVFLPIIESEANASDPVEEVDPNEDDEEKVVRILSTEAVMASHLAFYPGWIAKAWDQEDGTWYVEFKSDASDEAEFLADGTVNAATGEIVSSFIPRELTTEEYQAGLAKIEAYLPNDAEIQARLGNPDLWEKWIDWDRWEQQWTVGYYRGLEEFIIYFNFWDDKPQVDRFTNPNQLEAQEQAEWVRNQAIELTFEIEGIWDILDGVDDWVTYVEPQDGGLWSVEIVAGGEEKFHALVNIESWTVVEFGE